MCSSVKIINNQVIMADEDTDWSYSETVPKPQISTLSTKLLSTNKNLSFHNRNYFIESFQDAMKRLLLKALCTFSGLGK